MQSYFHLGHSMFIINPAALFALHHACVDKDMRHWPVLVTQYPVCRGIATNRWV